MTLKYDEIQQLLGGATPVGIQCVYTCQNPDESIEMCEQDEATFVSVYLRTDNDEVVPVADHAVANKWNSAALAKGYARNTIMDLRALLGNLPIEPMGALT